jgi:hypothetical protein
MTDKEGLPEDLGTAGEVTSGDENPNRAERIDDRHPRDRVAGKEKGNDLRSIVKSAMKEHDPEKEQARQKTEVEKKPRQVDGKFTAQNPAQDRASAKAVEGSPAAKEIPEGAKSGETAPRLESQTQVASAAPANAPKEVKDIWEKLPQEAQTIFAKREADMAKGVEQLKAKYKPIDDAFAPHRSQLQQLGKTEADAVSQLFGWHEALRGPNKVEAFKALAQAHQINLSSLTGQQAPPVAQEGQNPPQTDITQLLGQHFQPILNKVTSLESELQRRDRERVEADIAQFSNGKPHFEKVSRAMAVLMNSGIASGNNPKEIFDDAYIRACRADPEVFTLIQQEEREKRNAELRAEQEAAAKKAAEEAEARKRKEAEEVAKARKATVGPRSGSPSGMAIAAKAKGQSVGDTIRGVIKDRSASI